MCWTLTGKRGTELKLNFSPIDLGIISFFRFFQNRLRGSGHGIAAARMDAKLNVAGWISEQMGGVR